MTKKNVQNTKVVEQPDADAQGVSEGTGIEVDTKATQEELSNGEEELSTDATRSGGEPTNDEGNSEVDTAGEKTPNEQKRDKDDDPMIGIEPKEITENRNRIAAEIFAKNSQCNELYFTADLIPFFVKSDAVRHGTLTLKNDIVVTIKRK